ncbi:hypothetical protein JCM3765_004063 [Sporobolomyces pararoseus]
MTRLDQIFRWIQDRSCFSADTERESNLVKEQVQAESRPPPSSGPPSGSQSIPYVLPSSPETLNTQQHSLDTQSTGSQFRKSINRVFASTYVRDPRFPETPPPHHTPDAVPPPRRHRIPPLDYNLYIRPAMINPYSDVYSPPIHHSAHLIRPMSSFAADLTLALEAIEEPFEPQSYRQLYGLRPSPPTSRERQRDGIGSSRPLLEADESKSSTGFRKAKVEGGPGKGDRKGKGKGKGKEIELEVEAKDFVE